MRRNVINIVAGLASLIAGFIVGGLITIYILPEVML